MAKTQIRGVAIRGVVCAVPGEPVPVTEFGRHFGDADVEKITKTVGLREVHRVAPGQTAGDLATAAAALLLEKLEWDPASVDGVIMVTQTPDYFCPATACVAHARLGLPDTAVAFDVNQGCSGYVYGLYLGANLVAGGGCRRFLLLAGDTSSQTTSAEDRSVAMLFGDAGTATALEVDPGAGPISFVLGTDGTGAPNLVQRAGAYRERATAESLARVDAEDGNRRAATEIYMDGLAIFNFTLQRVPPLVRGVLELHGWTNDDPRAFLFHQANGFILNMMAKKLKLRPEQVPVNIGKYGNTSMSSIPLLLADDMGAELTAGAAVPLVIAGFGIGYSWAAAALTLEGVRVAEVFSVPAEAPSDRLQPA